MASKKSNVTVNFRLYEKGNTLGFLSATIGCVTLHGITLMNGKNGEFLSFPSRKDKDGKFRSHFYIDNKSDTYKSIMESAMYEYHKAEEDEDEELPFK